MEGTEAERADRVIQVQARSPENDSDAYQRTETGPDSEFPAPGANSMLPPTDWGAVKRSGQQGEVGAFIWRQVTTVLASGRPIHPAFAHVHDFPFTGKATTRGRVVGVIKPASQSISKCDYSHLGLTKKHPQRSYHLHKVVNHNNHKDIDRSLQLTIGFGLSAKTVVNFRSEDDLVYSYSNISMFLTRVI
jgi:hypothetical protein